MWKCKVIRKGQSDTYYDVLLQGLSQLCIITCRHLPSVPGTSFITGNVWHIHVYVYVYVCMYICTCLCVCLYHVGVGNIVSCISRYIR